MRQRKRNPRRGPIALIALASGILALAMGAALAFAAPEVPLISKVSFAEVTGTSATLKATINPGERKTKYRFEYVDQATFEAEGFATPSKAPTPNGVIAEGSEDVAVQVPIEGLTPATVYHLRVFAENSKGEVTTPERTFTTLAAPPSFGPCPQNEDFRSGKFSPLTHPSAALPECRAYEQASPVDKNGDDTVGEAGFIGAASDGQAIDFMSDASIPGAEGAQTLPSYLALRGEGESGWSTYGLLPPASAGPRAAPLGWLPDFSQTFTQATRLGQVAEKTLFVRTDAASPPIQATPYTPMAAGVDFSYAGASADGSKIAFEASVKLPPAEGEEPIAAALQGASNVYVYDEPSAKVSLASVLNTEAETKAALPKGALAGPYNWMEVSGFPTLTTGGSAQKYYTQDEHAIAADGSVFFTAAGSGQLYERLNPTEPQSALDGQGECTEAAKACTIQVSATHRTPADPAGSRPAAFMAATPDGSKAFFTSSEKLTDDANTGPVQPPAQIGRAKLEANEAKEIEPGFLPAHAAGVAIGGGYVYWADPIAGTIGRAKLNGTEKPTDPDPQFIVPGPTEAETHPKKEPGVIESGPSSPRYVAVDSEYVYWTNTGPLGESGNGQEESPVDGAGTIGRAKLTGSGVGEIKPEFIKGASDPQGIAVNAEHLYWANGGDNEPTRTIARAEIDGGKVEQEFAVPHFSRFPLGVALSPSYVYFGLMQGDAETEGAFIGRVPLEGGEAELLGIGETSKIRGVAVEGSHVYWAAQGEGAIGRANLELEPASLEKEFVKPTGTLTGLATDGEHLYWSVNGETPPNPGNDLYRYDAQSGDLSDLTVDPGTPNGAEVVGVLGASEDGSYLYFTANGDLDGGGEEGPASAGNCHGRVGLAHGSCSLYLWHEGQIGFVARLKGDGSPSTSDAYNWAGSTGGGSNTYQEKTSFLAPDGRTLLFRSQQKLTAYDNEGVPQYYRYRPGEPILCLTCNPAGTAPSAAPTLATYRFPALEPLPSVASVAARHLAAGGQRAFFETTEALVGADTDGVAGCPPVGSGIQSFPACRDVYEWEAPGAGSCEVGGPGFSPLNGGCIYLLSPGNDNYTSLFADASASGDDVFFFTRKGLVGQDEDQLVDVYDARVGGGLASQNPLAPEICEGEGCKPATTPAPGAQSPGSASFQGPGNKAGGRAPARCRKPKRRVKGRCTASRKHHSRHHHKRANSERKGSR